MSEIMISQNLEENIKTRIKETNFESVEEYVNFVLREVVESEPPNEKDSDPNRDLEDQLENLGYL